MKSFGRFTQGSIMAAALVVCAMNVAFGLSKIKFHRSGLEELETEPASFAGKVVECSSGFKLASHAEVLAYGLEDPRGLAYDAHNRRILIADGPRRKLISYSIARKRFEQAKEDQPFEYCPEGLCEAADLRGLSILKDMLYVAEHDRARIAVRAPGQAPDKEYKLHFPPDENRAAGPSGIAFDENGNTAFVTVDYSQPSPLGAVYGVKTGNGGIGEAELIGSNLPHPSGVALSPDGLALYVTTCDGQQTQWIIFRKGSGKAGKWQRSGILAAGKAAGGFIPAYQGILVGEGGHIYAAGPGGIHVYNLTGASLGRMEFHGRVAGLAWGFDEKDFRRYIYFTAGHTLCRLAMEEECDLP